MVVVSLTFDDTLFPQVEAARILDAHGLRGTFYVNPAHSHHYVHVAQDSILQVTGSGPWEVKFLAGPKTASPGR